MISFINANKRVPVSTKKISAAVGNEEAIVKSIYEEFDNLSKIVDMIAAHMGEDCEVVLHDLRDGFDSSIVKIANGHVTGRDVGGCGTNMGLAKLRDDQDMKGEGSNYMNQLTNGHLIKSSTMYIRDETGAIIGAICINLDITQLVAAQQAVSKVSGFSFDQLSKETLEENEVFVNNVGDLIAHFIHEWQGMIKKPAALLTRDEKIRAVKFFDSKGVFLITKAGDKISEYINVSKFTLYQYLEVARKKHQPEDERKESA